MAGDVEPGEGLAAFLEVFPGALLGPDAESVGFQEPGFELVELGVVRRLSLR